MSDDTSTQTVRVLLVEDNDHDAEIVQRMLAKYAALTFELDRVCDTTECLRRLEDTTFDMMLLDYSLPGEDGVTFLQRLNGKEGLPPVIMLTGWGDGRVAAEAMQNGACDYFPKNSINSDILAHAIHNAVSKFRSGNEEKRLRDELQQLVITDELTGVFNRRYLTQALERECTRARRYGREISCLMIDLDDFKKCNDRYGHLVGDMALKQVAAVICESVREGDDVTRYGGEEFVVIMPETPRGSASLAAERIRAKLSERPLVVDQQPVRITVSIGICTPGEDHDTEPEAVLTCADAALRDAKAAGKNRVCQRSSDAAGSMSAPSPGQQAKLDAARTFRVLLVEDDPTEARLIRMALEKCTVAHFEIQSVPSVSACRVALGQTPFDVVLLDNGLPGESGLDFLRSTSDVARPPVIMLTGHGDEMIAKEAIKAGARDYLSKNTVDLAVLGRTVCDSILQESR